MVNNLEAALVKRMKMRNDPKAFPKLDEEYNLAIRDYESSPNLRIVDRIQVQLDELRYGFLYRHPTRWHWCAYVLCPERDWNEHESIIQQHWITEFAMPANEPLCWMERNTNGLLKNPVELTDADFFIGFACNPNSNSDEALASFYTFESIVDKVRHGYLTA